MRLLRSTTTRLFSLRRKPFPIPPPGPPLPQSEAVDEEICPGYDSKKFYPANPGDIFANRYQILTKVGGPEGRHLCLAYEPMRKPIWLFQRRFKDGRIPLPIIKTYIHFLLVDLYCLHTECKVFHTDLKLENIMVTSEDPAVLGDFMNSQLDQPMQHKIDSAGRAVYRCHNDFGPLRKVRNIPKFVDVGLATRLSYDERGVYPIPPDRYRAPEVIFGSGWTMTADIWNMGSLVALLQLWDILQGKELFQQIYNEQGHYNAKAHLAEMIALLGRPPPELIARSQSMKWPEPLKWQDG
ncbi:kinase-like domain-containing protein [Aspergillus bertholletiae]|uniref:Kinase-like domain-containing protein n=1 Tax=Aspergillus bertholletiae TaxID=1226010 RepID=A0A5N7B4F4_9EURO|nr:kinase-like domain-containing protein [Aspergillus bertholletiae]